MHIKKITLLALYSLIISTTVFAEERKNAIYHAFKLETGIGSIDNGSGILDWDFDGWVGTDEHKLWLKSEAERENGITHKAELWAMYSHNLSTFWDIQIGIRHDTKPKPLAYAVIGFEGLAPYFFETETHLFFSENDDVSLRIRQANEFLITQQLITEPYFEANIFAQNVPELDLGSGLSSAELGVQIRYEFSRKFASYVDVTYEQKFGNTSSIAKNKGEKDNAFVGTIGLKWLF